MPDKMTPEREINNSLGCARCGKVIEAGHSARVCNEPRCFDCVYDTLFKAELETLRSQIEAQRWIAVSERLPELSSNREYRSAPVQVAENHPDFGWIQDVDSWDYRYGTWYNSGKCTHWRPLPSPPLTDTQSEGNHE